MTDIQKTIVKAFAENNMNTEAAAKKTFRHRNSVYVHLNLIQRKTGLDPRNFFDLIKLYEMAMEEGHADGT